MKIKQPAANSSNQQIVAIVSADGDALNHVCYGDGVDADGNSVRDFTAGHCATLVRVPSSMTLSWSLFLRGAGLEAPGCECLLQR